MNQYSVDSILIFLLSLCLIEGCPVHPAIVPAVESSVYWFGNMLVQELDHIEKVVLVVVGGFHGDRPEVVLTHRKQNLQSDVLDFTF